MRKADGSYTYFVPDVAYHLDKWQRGFQRVINEQGADHHSTITRVRAGLQALAVGIPPGWPDYVLHQMVTVLRGGEEVKISKRAGSYVTLRDLIEEVGRDATRFFFLMRRADAQLVFDIDLAKQQGNENPVYYVQYAHARVCSINRTAAEQGMALPGAGEADLAGADPRRGAGADQAAGPATRRWWPAPPKASSRTASPSTCRSWRRPSTATTIASACWSTTRRLPGRACCWSTPCASCLRNALGLLGMAAPERM